MPELAAILFVGVALGGVIGAAFGWDYGYEAGSLDQQRLRAAAEARLMDSIGEVL